MLLLILRKWRTCALRSILTYMEAHLYTRRTAKHFSSVTIQTRWHYWKKNPSTNSPKSFWDWVTNIPFRKSVFILIRLHHTRTKDTVYLGRLAGKNTAFINPIKSGLIKNVAFTAIPITSYLLVPNTPHELLPWYNLPFPHSSPFWILSTKFWTKLPNLSFPRCHNTC